MLRVPFVFQRVSSASGTNSAGLARRSRFLAAIVGTGLLAVLLLASQLRPDPRGWGTHEQLGLPPCTFFLVVGKRCPACGMTTAWANVTHLRFADALRANASGAVLAVAAFGVGCSAIAVAVRGKRLAWQPKESAIAGLALLTASLVICEWVFRLLTE